MNEPKIISVNKECTIQEIEYSEWRCELFGTGSSMTLTPIKGTEPNWFWRWMQWLAFGNRWYKKEKK